MPDGSRIDRVPAWIKRVTQDLSFSPTYDSVFWNPPKKYQWKNKAPPKPTSLKVYEAHGKLAFIFCALRCCDNIMMIGRRRKE